jgi:uncharacterized protein (TIGR02996 family)
MDHSAFCQAILESPDEDAHRLVYADWLDDQGDAERAEFIRAQCERARLPTAHPRARTLASREAALLEKNRLGWATRIAELVNRFGFRRGFVEEISLSAAQFVRRGEELFTLTPVRRVHLRSLHELVSLLADQGRAATLAQLLGRVPELDFNREYLSDAAGRALLSLPSLPSPRRLHLSHCSLSAAGVETLANCPVLAKVESLEISAAGAGPEGLHALLHSPRLRKLTQLQLTNARLGDRGIGVLTGSPLLNQLRRLSLGHNGLGPAGVHALVSALRDGPLEALDLSFNPLGANGVLAFLAGPSGTPKLPHLRELNLSRTDLGSAGARLLAESALLGQLASLDLSLNRIEDEGGRFLCKAPPTPRLLALDLIYNHIGEQVAGQLREKFGADVCLFSR